MPDITLKYDVLEAIAKRSDTIGKQANEYANRLASQVTIAISNVAGQPSAYLDDAGYFVNLKIKQLEKKSQEFYNFADQVTILSEIANRVDEEVKNLLAQNQKTFLKHHESLRINGWKADLLNLLIDAKNMVPFPELIGKIMSVINTPKESLKNSLKYWYNGESEKLVNKIAATDFTAASAAAFLVLISQAVKNKMVTKAIGDGIAANKTYTSGKASNIAANYKDVIRTDLKSITTTLVYENSNTIRNEQITLASKTKDKAAKDSCKTITLKEAKKIAREITAEFEGGLYAVAGNFDGAGLSIGYLQYNLDTGSLQPLLDCMANGKDTKAEFEKIFNFEIEVNGVMKKGYEIVREMLKLSEEEQIAWGNSISQPPKNRDLIKPWKAAFNELAHSKSFLNIEDTDPVTIYYYDNATKIMNKLGLNTVRGYALAFDISVNNGSISNAEKYKSWDLINAAMEGKGALLNPDDSRFSLKGLDPKSSEYAKRKSDRRVVEDLIRQLKNVKDPTLRKCYFAGAAAALQKGCSGKYGNWTCYSWDSWTRKVAILDGSEPVHGKELNNSKLTDDPIE